MALIENTVTWRNSDSIEIYRMGSNSACNVFSALVSSSDEGDMYKLFEGGRICGV